MGIGLLIPIALALGLLGLGAFFWSLGNGQFEDLDGAALRILMDEDDSKEWNGGDTPAPEKTPDLR